MPSVSHWGHDWTYPRSPNSSVVCSRTYSLITENSYVLIFWTFLSQLKAGLFWGYCYPYGSLIGSGNLSDIYAIGLGIYWLFGVIVPFSILKILSLKLCHTTKPLYMPSCCCILYNAPFISCHLGKKPQDWLNPTGTAGTTRKKL